MAIGHWCVAGTEMARLRVERLKVVNLVAKEAREWRKKTCVEKIWTPWLSVIGAWLELKWETKWKLLSPSATTSPVGKLREELARKAKAREEKERQGKEEREEKEERARQERVERDQNAHPTMISSAKLIL